MLKKFIGIIISFVCGLISLACVGIYVGTLFAESPALKPAAGILTLMFACIFVYIAARILGKILFPRKQECFMRCFVIFSYILYCLLLINFLFFETTFSREPSFIFLRDAKTAERYLKEFLNIRPLDMICRYVYGYSIGTVSFKGFFMNVIGNFVLFMPFAFFLPYFCEKQHKFRNFFLSVMLISLSVEFLQVIFMTGTGDVDDIILNTFGSCVMFAFLHMPVGKKLIERFFK